MARVSQDKVIKTLVAKVKELWTEADDDAIQIVLQQYDFNVDQTVQAFLDGTAEESLGEWKSLGSGTKTTASKKKKKNKNKHSAQNQENSNPSQSVPAAKDVEPEISLCNGEISTSTLVNGCHLSELELASAKEQQHSRVPAYEPPPQKSSVQPTRPKEDYKQMSKKARDRTLSEASTSSAVDKPSKNPHAGLEKSCKDLQRQTVALQRLKTVLNDHLEKSFKRISEVFKELHNQLNEREAQLIFEMDKVKTQANDVLEDQQRKAVALKHQTDRAQVMKDAEIADLRTKIKLFVSERKHYEDLSNTQRFLCDFNHMLEELKKFGEVVPVKTNPDHRRASVASLGSNISHEDVTSPSKSSSAVPNLTSQTSSSSQSAVPTAAAPVAAAPVAAAPVAAASVAAAPVVIPNSAHVLMQSESLTKYEATEMAQRLANLTLNDSKESSASANVRSQRSDRGRGSRGRGGGTSTGSSDRGAKPNSGEQQRDQQSARGQGQSRGGRGQGRSNRGQGQTRSATESNSQRSELTSAQPSEKNEAKSPASPRNSSSHQATQPKSPNSPRRGTRQGGRRDSRQQTSGDSSAKAESTAKQHLIESHNDSSGDADKTGAALPVSSSPAADGLANGQAEALPQRGTRTNRRGRGGGKQGPDDQQTGVSEAVLANGE